MIVVYTSSHGWGHNVRTTALLNELYDYPLEIVTTAPDWLITSSLHNKRKKPLTIRTLLTDPGAIQHDPFNIDIDKSIEAWEKIFNNLDTVLKEEVELLKSKGQIKLILSDISFFGQLVAEQLHVPSVCVATFDWAFIYRDFYQSHPAIENLINKVQEISARFDYCLIPGTMCRPLSIGQKQIEFNWGSRKPTLFRTEIRKKLGLSIFMDAILLSFGGFQLRQLPPKAWERFKQYEFFVLLPKKDCVNEPAPNVHFLPSEEWSGMHVDLVDSVDVVFGKVGYGLCSEVLHCKKPFLSVHRDGNREETTIKKQLVRAIPFREITQQQFMNGDWYFLNDLIDMKFNDLDYISQEVNGEVQMAEWIRNLLGDKKPRSFDYKKAAILILILSFVISMFLYFAKLF